MTILSWLRTPATLKVLALSAASAQDLITEAFARAHVKMAANEVAWGQYIDRPEARQVGLYGAAAGVGSLKRAPIHTKMRQKGIRYLLRRYEERRSNTRDRYQFELIPKIAGFLRGFGVADLTNSKISKACLELISDINSAQVVDAGWGYYTTSTSAAISPSCLVMLAVNDLGLWSHLKQGRIAGTWLASQVSKNYRFFHPGELALALHAIHAYMDNNPDDPPESGIKAAHKWLVRQLRLSPVAWHDYLVSYSVISGKGKTQQENDEYFVMPSALMILHYLCSYRPFDLMRPPVLSHVIEFIERIISSKMYTSAMNNRASSRENQWAFDICLELKANLRSSRATLSFYGYLAGLYSIVSKKVLVYSTLLFAAVFPAIHNDPGLLVGGFALAVFASIVAGVITEGS